MSTLMKNPRNHQKSSEIIGHKSPQISICHPQDFPQPWLVVFPEPRGLMAMQLVSLTNDTYWTLPINWVDGFWSSTTCADSTWESFFAKKVDALTLGSLGGSMKMLQNRCNTSVPLTCEGGTVAICCFFSFTALANSERANGHSS